MDFCVYALFDKFNVIRYVGSGTTRRLKDIKHKSRKGSFVEIFNDGGRIDILRKFSSKDEAVTFENELLLKYLDNKSDGYDLINKTGPRNHRLLDHSYLDSIFYYDETSPTKLRWKIDKVKSNGRLCSKARKGFVAGTNYSVLFDGKTYQIHRVIWTLCNAKDIPVNMVINHIDGNPANNSISNLELCSQRENICKIVNNKTTNTGIRGVSIRPNHGLPDQLICTSYITKEGKQVNKYYSIAKYGQENAIKLACEWRKQKLMETYPDIYESML